MSCTKKFCFIFMVVIIASGFSLREGRCQYPGVPYPVFMPWAQVPPFQFLPAPIIPIPYARSPHATIIISPGITAVSPTAGVVVIGAPTVVSPTTAATIVSTTPTTTAPAAPAPLFSILATLYSSAVYDSPLSIANPLLFAYLSTLII